MLYCRLFPFLVALRFILRMELNANPLASKVDPFGGVILARFFLCLKFMCTFHHTAHSVPAKMNFIEGLRCVLAAKVVTFIKIHYTKSYVINQRNYDPLIALFSYIC